MLDGEDGAENETVTGELLDLVKMPELPEHLDDPVRIIGYRPEPVLT
jgi:hypothetical protein